MPIQITIIIVAAIVLALLSWFAFQRAIERMVEKRVQQILTVRRELEEGWSAEEHKRQRENALTLRVLQQEVQSHRQLMLTLSAPVGRRPDYAELKIIDWVLEHFQTLSCYDGVPDRDLEFASHLLTRWQNAYRAVTEDQREERRTIEEALSYLLQDEAMRTSSNALFQRCLGMLHLLEVFLDDKAVPTSEIASALLAIITQINRLDSLSS